MIAKLWPLTTPLFLYVAPLDVKSLDTPSLYSAGSETLRSRVAGEEQAAAERAVVVHIIVHAVAPEDLHKDQVPGLQQQSGGVSRGSEPPALFLLSRNDALFVFY